MKQRPYTARFKLPPGLKTLDGRELPGGEYKYASGHGTDVTFEHERGTLYAIDRSDVIEWIKDGLVPADLLDEIFPASRPQ
jgi:hypothetical protein